MLLSLLSRVTCLTMKLAQTVYLVGDILSSIALLGRQRAPPLASLGIAVDDLVRDKPTPEDFVLLLPLTAHLFWAVEIYDLARWSYSQILAYARRREFLILQWARRSTFCMQACYTCSGFQA